MAVASALVGGGGIAGCLAAIALAQDGIEVTVAAGGPGVPDGEVPVRPGGLSALHELGIEPSPADPAAVDLRDAVRSRLSRLQVEVRPDAVLVGWVNVDRHVEAELSDGRVENYDLVVVTDAAASGWRVIAGDLVRPPAALAAAADAVVALASSS